MKKFNSEPMSFQSLFFAIYFICIATAFFACGNESGAEVAATPIVSEVETSFELGKCTYELEGISIYVKRENVDYVCINSNWVRGKGDAFPNLSSSLDIILTSSNSNDISSSTQDIQLAAKFHIRFFPNADSVSGIMSDQIFLYDVPQYLNANKYQKNRCGFQGWALSPEGNVVYKDRDAVTISNNINLYAKWYCSEPEKCIENVLTDYRDGQTYRIISFGYHTWMAENLRYNPLSPGYDWSWCYEELESNCKYGRYYTYAAALDSLKTGCGYKATKCQFNPNTEVRVQGICPNGWHIPVEDDFKELAIIRFYKDTCNFFSNMIGSSSGLEYYVSFNNRLDNNKVYFYQWGAELDLWTTSWYHGNNETYGSIVKVRHIDDLASSSGLTPGFTLAVSGYPIRCVKDSN
ncbi:MAG: hypothetical protein MJZ22_04425 [Candidatus Saccharibacteria bacterium]|nr:hypothetical protein [Candidatus Saccharibacteria bacterium]MCQ2061249.1 hypothetical protein [Fibrobacter sp.]